MYGSTSELNNKSGYTSGIQTQDVPADSGISSAVKELISQVQSNANLIDNLKSSLGISTPKEESGQNPTPSSLMWTLRELTSVVRSSNFHLDDVLRHLNS